jgi:hypothetical protein
MASVFVTATGFVLLGTNLTGPQAGFILVFAVNASQGGSHHGFTLPCVKLTVCRSVQLVGML